MEGPQGTGLSAAGGPGQACRAGAGAQASPAGRCGKAASTGGRGLTALLVPETLRPSLPRVTARPTARVQALLRGRQPHASQLVPGKGHCGPRPQGHPGHCLYTWDTCVLSTSRFCDHRRSGDTGERGRAAPGAAAPPAHSLSPQAPGRRGSVNRQVGPGSLTARPAPPRASVGPGTSAAPAVRHLVQGEERALVAQQRDGGTEASRAPGRLRWPVGVQQSLAEAAPGRERAQVSSRQVPVWEQQSQHWPRRLRGLTVDHGETGEPSRGSGQTRGRGPSSRLSPRRPLCPHMAPSVSPGPSPCS